MTSEKRSMRMNTAASTSSQDAPRFRLIKRACVNCHSRKVRCDGAVHGFPCSNCRSAGAECTVAQRRKRTRNSAQRVHAQAASDQEAQPPSRVHSHSHNHNHSHGAGSEAAVESPRSLPRPVAPESAPTPLRQDGQDGQDAGNQDDTSPTVAEYAKEYELAREHLVDFFGQNLQENPIRARLTYVGNELSNLNYLTRQRAANHHVYHYPSSSSYIPRVFKNSQNPVPPSLIPKDAFVVAPRHVSDVLVAAYFAEVHPTFPIINKDSFLSAYHDSSTASPPLILLQAICLVGSHVTKAFKNQQDLKVSFSRRTKALLDGRHEEDRMEIVQAALLMTWFSDGGDDVCANAWWWIGVAARTAIGLGMHREVGPSKMPEGDKRTWRRIWWCLVQFDCLVSLCYGRPQIINLEDCDVPPLCLEDFDASSNPKDANFVIYHAGLCAIISEQMRSHFSIKARKMAVDREKVLESVDAVLATWLVSVPADLRQQTKRTAGEQECQALLLQLTYHTALVQLHRTVSADADAPKSDRARDDEICADGASVIVSIFEQLHQWSSLRRCWFWAPSSLFTALLQIKGQLSYNNPVLALRAREKYESGLRSLRRLSRYWLFASSVWRLFQSKSVDATVNGEQESPMDTVSSIECPTSNQDLSANPHGDQPDEMCWIQPVMGVEATIGHDPMHLEQNRWHDSLELQSLYWSDALTNIQLEDTWDGFQQEWPPG